MTYYPSKKYKHIPQDVYIRALYAIRSLPRLYEDIDNLLHEQNKQDVTIKSNLPGKPTENIAMRREKKLNQIRAIEKAFDAIPKEYKDIVFNNIIGRVPREDVDTASASTVSRYRQIVIVEVAHNAGLIDDKEYQKATQK